MLSDFCLIERRRLFVLAGIDFSGILSISCLHSVLTIKLTLPVVFRFIVHAKLFLSCCYLRLVWVADYEHKLEEVVHNCLQCYCLNSISADCAKALEVHY